MATDRQFCRFNKGESTATGRIDQTGLTTKEIPEGGLCLSSFLLLKDSPNGDSVLMGHLNPRAPWDHIGALDENRIEVHRKGWMLPSCHLMLFESPLDAARRISREQLGLGDELPLTNPLVVSEISTPKRFQNLPDHWDIEFIFIGSLDRDRLSNLNHPAWTDLRFVNPRNIARSSIARSHEDILESVGFTVAQ